ncbi:MAG: YcaO-like family protein [Bryobacteraceae bacterium]
MEHGLPEAAIHRAVARPGLSIVHTAAARLLACGNLAEPGLAAIAREATPWLLVQIATGVGAFVGPRFRGEYACWTCLAQMLRANGWEPGAHRDLNAADLSALAFAAKIAETWPQDHPADRGFAEFAPDGRLACWHPAPRISGCADCGRRARERPADCDLISPLTGILTDCGVRRIAPGLFVARGLCSRRNYSHFDGGISPGRPIEVGGKGENQAAATAGCLGEAVERSSLLLTGRESFTRASFHALGTSALDPNTMLPHLCSFDRSKAFPWVDAVSFKTGEKRFVLAEVCFLGFGSVYHAADTGGCATAPTAAGAIHRAVLELIERDSVALWWCKRTPRPELDWRSLNSPRLSNMARHCEKNGRCWWLLDLTSDCGVLVCAAISARRDGTRIAMGTGAGIDWESAAWSAAAEMAILADEIPRISAQTAMNDANQARILSWWRRERLDGHPYLVAKSGARRYAPLSFAATDISASTQSIVDRLADLGHELYLVDHTLPNLDRPVFRAIVPSLIRLLRPSLRVLDERSERLGQNGQPGLNAVSWFL